jgi:acylpyruvate hydrolase
MKLANIAFEDGVRAAIVEGDEVRVLEEHNLTTVLASPTPPERLSVSTVLPLQSVRLLPPTGPCSKFVGIGLNFQEHIVESGLDQPAHPMIFAKFPSALIGPHDDILLPSNSVQTDWEGEFGVVVGQRVRYADEAEAARAIAGFILVNDVSIRDWQLHTSQYFPGKNFDASTPLGPWIVGVDELGTNPDIEVTTRVDGEIMQQARTVDLVFNPAQLISYISGFCAMNPGDVIATGSPGGVGHVRNPPIYLEEGQFLETSAPELRALRNRCTHTPSTVQVAL